MGTRVGVVVMTILLALYLWLVGARAVALIVAGATEGQPVALIMGIAIIVLPFIAVWGIGRELWFGWRAQRLGEQLDRENALPNETLATHPSGRLQRAEAEALFPRYRAAVEADESDWRAWYRLSLVYDAAGDRKRARQAAREAISRERVSS